MLTVALLSQPPLPKSMVRVSLLPGANSIVPFSIQWQFKATINALVILAVNWVPSKAVPLAVPVILYTSSAQPNKPLVLSPPTHSLVRVEIGNDECPFSLDLFGTREGKRRTEDKEEAGRRAA